MTQDDADGAADLPAPNTAPTVPAAVPIDDAGTPDAVTPDAAVSAGDAGPTATPTSGPPSWPDSNGPVPAQAVPADTEGELAPASVSPPRRWLPWPRRRKRQKAPWWELPALIVVAIGVAVLIKTFVVQPFYIPSQSMEQTLHGCPACSGDRILVNKPIYHLRSPHPGDIIVFKAPTDEWFNEPFPAEPSNPVAKVVRKFGQLVGVIPPDEHDLVKRVIAVGGQTIKCCDAQGNIQVSDTGPNGPWRTLHESYIYDPLSPTAGAFGPVTIPKGRLWVMGDNRSDSEDSRWHFVNDYRGDVTLSTVPSSDVVGKAFVIAWPPSRWRTLGTPSTFTSAQALGSGAIPVAGAALVVLPVGLVRRRRRRQ
jgi:signal peptidase I